MAFRGKSADRHLSAIGAVLVSAAAFYFSTGFIDLWPLLWIAPIPVLLVAFRAPVRKAAAVGFTAYLLGGLNLLSYYAGLMPVRVVVLVLVFPAVIFALCVLAARRGVRRLPAWLAALAFPAGWTTWEWLSALTSPHGTGGSLAYSQVKVLPLLQIASVTGIWGMIFLVMLVPSSIAIAWHFRTERQRVWAALAPAVIVAAGVFGYGFLRLAPAPANRPIRVGLAATDRTIRYYRTERPEEAMRVAEEYAERVRQVASRGARVAVLPEKFVGITAADRDAVLRVFAESARANHVMIVAGFNVVGQDPPRNIAVVFSPEGSVVAEYDKHHLLPGPETPYRPGNTPAIIDVRGQNWGVETCGVAICKDMDFTGWSRQYARRGALIMFVPAWDFAVDAWLHGRIAIVRGVEEGFAVVRAAQDGNLTVTDDRGRMIAMASTLVAPEALVVADVSPGNGHTVYQSAGDWFGWVALGLLVGLIAWPAAQRTQVKPQG
jgi:apolipoprotein N-acyltransferase